MAKEIKLKAESEKIKIAFGNSAKRLGERTPEDIEKLALLALEAKDSYLLSLFESIPTLDELKQKVVENNLPKLPAKPGEVVPALKGGAQPEKSL